MAGTVENTDIVELLKKTYCFYRQKYVIMKPKYTKTVNHYFTDKVIGSHIEGRYALAVFAGEKVTRFLSVDVDEGGKKAAHLVIDTLVELGIPRDRIYISTSGKKGYHVDVFFSPWIYNEKAKNLYELMIWRSQLNPKKVEYRPTASQAIKLPLGLHPVTGNRCWFLDRETLKPIERFDYLEEITPVSGEVIADILRTWNKKRWSELYADMICNETGRDESIAHEVTFNEAYYEAKELKEIGTRHQVMVEIACDLRHYGANAHQITKALKGFYYRQDPLYIETSEDGVLEDIGEIARWAEESVPIWHKRETTGEPKTISFSQNDANCILSGPTSATRKVALLIWSYCKMFGAAHVAYSTIAETVGCRVATAETAVKKLVEMKIINRQSGGCHYANGKLVRKSNTYFIPKEHQATNATELYMTNVKISRETFDSFYYAMLTSLCSEEDLREHLTKPEFDECVKIVNGCEST